MVNTHKKKQERDLTVSPQRNTSPRGAVLRFQVLDEETKEARAAPGVAVVQRCDAVATMTSQVGLGADNNVRVCIGHQLP